MKRIRTKVRIHAQEQWWVSNWIEEHCEKTWLHPEGEHTILFWPSWLKYEKKKDERRTKEGVHKELVKKMMASVEGGAGFLHNITTPAPSPLILCEVPRQKRAMH